MTDGGNTKHSKTSLLGCRDAREYFGENLISHSKSFVGLVPLAKFSVRKYVCPVWMGVVSVRKSPSELTANVAAIF